MTAATQTNAPVSLSIEQIKESQAVARKQIEAQKNANGKASAKCAIAYTIAGALTTVVVANIFANGFDILGRKML